MQEESVTSSSQGSATRNRRKSGLTIESSVRARVLFPGFPMFSLRTQLAGYRLSVIERPKKFATKSVISVRGGRSLRKYRRLRTMQKLLSICHRSEEHTSELQ